MGKFLQKLFILIALFVLAKPVMAQDYLVDYTFLGTKSKLELYLAFGQPVDYAVDLYRIHYKTPGVDMLRDTASGLIAVPQVPVGTLIPLVVYEHGTTSGPADVPSRLKGGYEVAVAYAAFGFATVAPDYLGLGDSRGFHPYVHAATEASASLDMLFAGYEYLEFHDNAELDPNFLFLSGYSQGGHASMALHKEIDDYWSIIIPVTAATHMSGPYSMSGVMRDRLLSDISYGTPAYMAYIILGYNQYYNLYTDLSEVFKDPYAATIDSFYQGIINLTVLNTKLLAQLSLGGNTIVKRMLQDTLLASVLAIPNHKFNLALADNDTDIWGPSSPTRLYYCGEDEQVPTENSTLAANVMQGMGAADLEAIDLNPSFGHGECVLPAVIKSIEFFLSFVNGTGIADPDQKNEELKFYPNPTTEYVYVDWAPAINGFDYRIFNANGQLADLGTTSSGYVSVSKLPAGMYTILCIADNQLKVGRVIRQ